MTYDHWKTTNPADEFLGPDPFEAEEEGGHYYVEPGHRTYAVIDERDGRAVEHFPYRNDWRVALQLAETLRDELNGGAL